MRFSAKLYELIYKKPAPYYFRHSLWTLAKKPFRKLLVNTIASNCPFNKLRVILYKIAGFDIGKHVFVGMHCYLDDMRYDLIHIGNNVVISYGVYFAAHGKNQKSQPITIKDGAYIGMRASIISNNRDKTVEGVTIGKNSIIGACTLVNCDIPDDAIATGIPCRIRKGNKYE